MANFKELNENLEIVLQKIISNQNLCKLIYFDTMDALTKEDIEDTSELLYTKIFPYSKNPETLEKASSMLLVGFDNFKSTSSNTFVNEYIYFRVLCHEELQRINGGLRTYMICHEISNLFNNQRVIGIGKTLFNRGNEIRTKDYSGFELVYKITEFSYQYK